jgi:hypothetical protein
MCATPFLLGKIFSNISFIRYGLIGYTTYYLQQKGIIMPLPLILLALKKLGVEKSLEIILKEIKKDSNDDSDDKGAKEQPLGN